jgi:hypothetical protein
MSERFWRLQAPEYESDNRQTYINGVDRGTDSELRLTRWNNLESVPRTQAVMLARQE